MGKYLVEGNGLTAVFREPLQVGFGIAPILNADFKKIYFAGKRFEELMKSRSAVGAFGIGAYVKMSIKVNDERPMTLSQSVFTESTEIREPVIMTAAHGNN